MIAPVDLADYLARIGWNGPPPAADRAALARLVALHTAAIPFENLDPFLARPVLLAPDRLLDKLVRGGRGGYCYEQNGLFRDVLATLGFSVTGLSARVTWMQPDDMVAPRSHMLLLVDLPDGPVLADVGFGGAVLTGVLDLVPDIEQQTPHEPFRLLESGGEWRQQIRIGEEWRTTYRFDLHPQLPIDYESANWWTATHPASHFTRGLTVARVLPDRRLGLRGRELATHWLGGGSGRRTLASASEVCDTLDQEFGIRIPDRGALIARLEALD